MCKSSVVRRVAAALAVLAALASPAIRPVSAQSDEPRAARIKWHPGHYVLPYAGESQAMRLRRLDEIGHEDVIRGAEIRYSWAELEPKKGSYDFSAIERDLERLQKHGKRLVIVVTDRSFGREAPEQIVPRYLLEEPEFGGGVAKRARGHVARLWDEAVMDREIALSEALGRRFDSEPFVEGIASQETAPGFGSDPPPDFDAAALAKQIERWIVATRSAWPHTNVFVYSNFLGKYVDRLVAACARNYCGVGGPDVIPPPGKPTPGTRALVGASKGPDYRGRIPVAYAVQTAELGGRLGKFTPAQLFEYAYDELRANYLFWVRNTGTGTPEQRWSTGILPYLRSIDGKIRTDCPGDWGDRCDTSGP